MIDPTQTSQTKLFLPPDVAEYFFSTEVTEQERRIATEFGLSLEQIPLLGADIFRFVSGDYSEYELKKSLKERLELSEERIIDLFSVVTVRIFAPIFDQVPGLRDRVRNWNQTTTTQTTAMNPEIQVRAFVAKFVEDLEPQKLHRLERIILDYLEKKRSKEETIEFLSRPFKLAGLEMDQQFARETIEKFDREFFRAPSLDTFGKKDEEEIKKVIETRNEILQPTISSLDEAVAKICLEISSVMEDPFLKERCREIVVTRVHNVRDKMQTRAMLAKSVEGGGLGMAGIELEKLAQVIEQNVEAFHYRKQKEIVKERQEKQIQKQEEIEKLEQMKHKETQLLNRRYVSVTGKVPTESVVPAAPPLARATAAGSIQSHLEQQAKRIDAQKVKQAIEKIIPQTKPNTQHPKPLVQDVQFTRRLSGPVDELRSMDLERFRRLSNEPLQAISRLKDMLDLLEEQGYEKRVQGVQAFRACPLYRQYMEVTQKALLNGKGIDAELGDLKRVEYDALIKLNSEIRF
ncbi:hypothetical protein HY771_03560 [Candidatus Uhrbacteria bacterium]|nr:hypothetical protein [Candidatus Uhrbacteria bacterium]